MNYGDFTGDTGNFLQVMESTLTDSVALYGTPTQTDDALNFNPTNFGAFSQFGGFAIMVNNPVPEPCSLSLLAIGATVFLRRRRA